MSLADRYTARELAEQLESLRAAFRLVNRQRSIAEGTLREIAAGRFTPVGARIEAQRALDASRELAR